MTMLYFVLSCAPKLRNIKNILIRAELLVSNKTSCISIINSEKDNCIVLALVNIIKRLSQINQNYGFDKSVTKIDVETAVNIILNKEAVKVESNVPDFANFIQNSEETAEQETKKESDDELEEIDFTFNEDEVVDAEDPLDKWGRTGDEGPVITEFGLDYRAEADLDDEKGIFDDLFMEDAECEDDYIDGMDFKSAFSSLGKSTIVTEDFPVSNVSTYEIPKDINMQPGDFIKVSTIQDLIEVANHDCSANDKGTAFAFGPNKRTTTNTVCMDRSCKICGFRRSLVEAIQLKPMQWFINKKIPGTYTIKNDPHLEGCSGKLRISYRDSEQTTEICDCGQHVVRKFLDPNVFNFPPPKPKSDVPLKPATSLITKNPMFKAIRKELVKKYEKKTKDNIARNKNIEKLKLYLDSNGIMSQSNAIVSEYILDAVKTIKDFHKFDPKNKTEVKGFKISKKVLTNRINFFASNL